MQHSVSSKPCWSQAPEAKSRQFYRLKDGINKSYIQDKYIGSGNTSVVYAIVPIGHLGKSKVIKIATLGELTKEFQLLNKINARGKQVGLVNAPKELIAKKIMIMSRYSANLHNLIRANQCPEQDVITALKQVLNGIRYLKEKNFYHGDIVASNIFIREKDGTRSYHLGDFGHGEDLNEFTTEQQFVCRFLKLQMLHYILPSFLSEFNVKPVHERLAYGRSLFYLTEAFAFGLLIKDISNELRSESKIKERLAAIGEDIMNARSIEGVEGKLGELSAHAV